jgi:hypothetical protein
MTAALVLLLGANAAAAQNSITTTGDIETAGRLVSKAASGPPLQVGSSTMVPGLNADLLDGNHAASFALDADLDALADLITTLDGIVADHEELIQRLHPKLSLWNGRFRAWVTFEDDGVLQAAEVVSLGDDLGYFYFTRDFYVDVFLRILDGSFVNAHWWLFAAPVTNVEYTLTVLDTETGETASYHSPQGALTTHIDITSFPNVGGYAAVAPVETATSVLRLGTSASASCTPSAQVLCLVEGRFEVVVSFDPDGPQGDTAASVSSVLQTSHTGAFWLFASSNVEILVEVAQKPTHFEVSIGTLTDVEFTVTVTDTCHGTSAAFPNPAGTQTNYFDDATFVDVSCP